MSGKGGTPKNVSRAPADFLDLIRPTAGISKIWIWRHVMKVSWTEHKTNEEILQMVETEREIMDTVRS